jgi:hypothetical protein
MEAANKNYNKKNRFMLNVLLWNYAINMLKLLFSVHPSQELYWVNKKKKCTGSLHPKVSL